MGTTTYFLLIRHGENEYVSTHRLAGRLPGVHLNDRGRLQAETIVQWLVEQPLAAVYSSPLERCIETATPLALARELPVVEEWGLAEVEYGDWQGRALPELGKLPEWGLVQHYPSLFRFPGGETLREVQHRGVAAIERLRDAHPDQVVAIFSHGDVIRTVLAHYLGVPLDLFQRIAIDTGAVSCLGFHAIRPAVLGINYGGALPQLRFNQAVPASSDPAVYLGQDI